jgi:anti-anti-sigma factor
MDPVTVQVNRRERLAVLRPSGDLDISAVLDLAPALSEILADGDVCRLTLELSDVTSIDLTAMTLMIDTCAQARRDDLELRLCRRAANAQPVLRTAAIEQAPGLAPAPPG